MKQLRFIVALAAGISSSANAKINFDFESDPLPLIKLNAIVPSTRLFKDDQENLGIRILEECFEAGTERLNKQKFQDTLASYGASLDVSLTSEYADFSLTFPLNAGKVPQGLIDLAKEAWEQPRVNKDTFERARKLLKANYLASLDRDGSLLSMALQKLIMISLFDLKPYSAETYDRITQPVVEEMQKNFYKKSEMWVGVIGPSELKKELAGVAQKIFPDAGAVHEGVMQSELETGYKPVQKGKITPTFVIIDKKDLAQVSYGFIRLNQNKVSKQTELVDDFTNYILTGSSLDSLYFRKIRTDKGLAYIVGGLIDSFFDYPAISLYSNPQRNKQAEAFSVLSEIVKETFDDPKILSTVNDQGWKGRLTSYRNSERQIGATPEGRIGRRKSIVMGDFSYELYKKPIDDWDVTKSEASKRLVAFSKNSNLLLGVIGDGDEVEPLVRKHFPQVKILRIPYKDVIKEAWLKR